MSKILDHFTIHFTHNEDSISIEDNMCDIIIMVHNISCYELCKKIASINNIIKLYDKIKTVIVTFDKKIKSQNILQSTILVKLHDIFYPNNKKIGNIEIQDIDKMMRVTMESMSIYKDVVMEPDKSPKQMLDWVRSNIPSNYSLTVKKISPSFFPLSYAVGKGSTYDSNFICICPKKTRSTSKNVFLVGKTITYDTGGLNIKTRSMHEMKTDMTGGALVLTVLNIMAKSKMDTDLNIHVLLPIVENMVGSKATKPGSVVKSMKGKTVEIINTDAEGRLCLADCMEYIEMELLEKKGDNLIIDVATLTGNATQITDTIACIGMSNKMGSQYMKEMVEIGEKCGEYIDVLKIHEEYIEKLSSPVADIKNSHEGKAGCVVAGQFLNYFVNDMAPWIHLDIAGPTYYNDMANGWGVNMLTHFLLQL
jgi:leucyl aminopeptidase